MRILFLVLSACLILLSSSHSFAQSTDWVIGTWQLSYDPDGDNKDQLVFKPNGLFTNISENGQKFNGKYQVNNGRIKVTLLKQGKEFMSFFLGYEKSKDELHFHSNETQKTSIYKKL